MFKKDFSLQASVFLFFTLILIQFVYIFISPDFKINFGAELGRIAESLVTGKGYSNPFGDTGATAWHLPFLILIIAFIFKITGITLTSYIILAGFKFLSLSLSFYFISKSISEKDNRIKVYILFVIFCFYFLFSPSQNLVMVCDLWIITLLVAAFLYSIIGFTRDETNKKFYLLIAVFFFAPMISPAYGLGFVLIITFIAIGIFFIIYFKLKGRIVKVIFNNTPEIISPKPKKIFFRYTLLIGAFSLSILIWSARNYHEFKKFVPSKSNMWFEFYITNIVDRDGQLSLSTSYLTHPVTSEDLITQIKNEGEIKWLKRYHDISKNYLENDFNDYLRNVQNRMYNAFIYIENDMDFIESDMILKFEESDRRKLAESKLIQDNGWISVFYTETEFNDILDQIEIINKGPVYSDWWKAKQTYQQKKYSLPNLVRSLFMSLIPLLCIFLLLMIKKSRKNKVIVYSVLLYFIYLVPYILISHQIRYQRPLFILQVIFVYNVIILALENFNMLRARNNNNY